MRKQDPPAPEVVPVGDEGVTNIDPSIVEPPTINAPPEPLHTSEEQPQAALSPEPMNADQGVAAGAAPPSDVAAYDPTVYEDAIVEPKCPVERFMNMKNGEEEVVRNTEYYNMFCAWMHEVAKPAYAWDLGHFIDQATVSFANRQFEPDSTCQPEVKIEESTARPSRSDIHDDNLQNCQQAWEKCEASEGAATQCDFLTTPACHGFQPKGAEIMEPGLPHVPAPAKPEPAAVASQPAPPAPTKPEPAKGTIPAGTGTTAQVIPVGTGGDLPGGEPTPPKESAGSSPSLVAEEKAEIFPESADSIAEPVN